MIFGLGLCQDYLIYRYVWGRRARFSEQNATILCEIVIMWNLLIWHHSSNWKQKHKRRLPTKNVNNTKKNTFYINVIDRKYITCLGTASNLVFENIQIFIYLIQFWHTLKTKFFFYKDWISINSPKLLNQFQTITLQKL